jgi:chromate reductase
VRILGISGSLRRESHNSRLLRAAARSLPPGAELEVYKDLALIPAFDEDRESDPPGAVLRLRDEIAAADALLFSTPEYNASIPGALKNAVDWVSRPFPDNALRDQPAAVIGTSTGLFGAVWAQAELRKVLRHAGAFVLDEEVPVPTADLAFTPADELVMPELGERLRDLLDALVREATAPLEAAGAHPAPRQPGAVPVGART